MNVNPIDSDSQNTDRLDVSNKEPSRIGTITSSIKNSIFSEVTEHPYRSLAIGTGSVLFGLWIGAWYGTAALTLVGGYFVYQEYQTPEQFRQRLETECSQKTFDEGIDLIAKNAENLPPDQLRQLIGFHVDHNWGNFGLPKYVNNPENKEFLAGKLFDVLGNSNLSVKEKNAICKNSTKNLVSLFNTFDKRIQEDLAKNQELQEQFGVDEKYSPSNVIILGDETHNKGNVPLRVELKRTEKKGSKTIVYKPRSTHPEATVCGLNGLFERLGNGLPTYRAVHVNHQYGYCEFLENKQEENMFEDINGLQTYMRTIVIMSKLAEKLGLNDLHRNNILTSRLRPCPIDMETILQPTKNTRFDTALLNGPQSGYMFEIEAGVATKNRVWGLDQIDDKMQEEKIKLSKDTSIDEFVEEYSKEIELCREELSEEPHRMVLISTDELKAQLRDGYNEGLKSFKKELVSGLDEWGFEEESFNLEEFEQGYHEDFMNNDVPVFYFDSKTGKVWYHNICLGTQKKG